MEITKYKHACVVLTKNNQSLVIDPGEWSDDFIVPENVIGAVVTHEHSDHFDLKKLTAIIAKNPKAYIYAHVSIIAQLGELPGLAVKVGATEKIGDFTARFVGGTHAGIHPDFSVPVNLGVIVDDGAFYYPGDSYTVPNCAVEVLAVPASAPWMKVAEAMDFITAVKPHRCFPTHNTLLSAEGHALTNSWLEKAASSCGTHFSTEPHLTVL